MSSKTVPTLLIAIFAVSILATAFPAQVVKATQPGELRVSATKFYGLSVIKVAVYDPDGISTDTWELWKGETKLISNLTKYATYTTGGEYVVYLAANSSSYSNQTIVYPIQYKIAEAIEKAEAELNPIYKVASKLGKLLASNASWNATLFDVDGDGYDDFVVNGTWGTGGTKILVDLYADYAVTKDFNCGEILKNPNKVDWVIWYNFTTGVAYVDTNPDSTPQEDESEYNITATATGFYVAKKYKDPKATLYNVTGTYLMGLSGYDADPAEDLNVTVNWVKGVGFQALGFYNASAAGFNYTVSVPYINVTTGKVNSTLPFQYIVNTSAGDPGILNLTVLKGPDVLTNYTFANTTLWFVSEAKGYANGTFRSNIAGEGDIYVINGSGMPVEALTADAPAGSVMTPEVAGENNVVGWPAIVLLPISEGDTITVKYRDAEDAFSDSKTITYDDTISSVSLDRSEYPPKGIVYVDIDDSDYNFDPTVSDYVYVNAMTPISVVVNPGVTGLEKELWFNSTGLDFFKESAGKFSAKLGLEGVKGVNFTSDNLTSGDTVRIKLTESGGVTVKKDFTIRTETGSIAVSATTMDYSDEVTITVSDFDLNKDSKAVDTVVVNTTVYTITGATRTHLSSGNASGAVYYAKLTETGANTGVFTGKITPTWDTSKADHSVTGNVLYMWKDDTARVKYVDKSPSKELTASVSIVTFAPSISLDRSTYPIGSDVKVTITDPDLNDLASAREIYTNGSLNSSLGCYYKVYKSGVEVPLPPAKDRLVETDYDSGVFELKFNLKDDIGAKAGDIIKVEYYDALNDKKVSASATVGATTASVSLNKAGYYYKSKVVITVSDPDLNANPLAVETHDFYYNSTLDPSTKTVTIAIGETLDALRALGYASGTKIPGTETGANTGVFVIKYIDLQTDLGLNPGYLGGTLSIKYNDTAGSGGTPTTVTTSASITANTGVLALDKTSYSVNSEVKVTLVDPDLNVNPDSADSVTLNWWTTTMGEGRPQPVTLTETGPDTGVFEGKFKLDTSAYPEQIRPGDTLTVRYRDEADASYVAANIDATASLIATSATLEVVKEPYYPFPMNAKVVVYIHDADMNTDASRAESVSVTVKSSKETETLTATETEVNSGVFKASFYITDQLPAPDGKLSVSPSGETIVIMYIDQYTAEGATNVQRQITAEVQQYDAKVWFEKGRYNMGEEATVWVFDPDANANPDLKESVPVRIYSDLDPAGITVYAVENGTNTGYFKATTIPSSKTAGNKIMAQYGSTVTAKYTDYTPKGETEGYTSLSVTDAFIVGALVQYPVPAAAPELKDPVTGEPTAAKVGKTVGIASTVTNMDVVAKPFTYIVQVKDSAGVVVHVAWITGTLQPGQSMSPSVGWTPSVAGDYTVEVYVWKSFAEPEPYSLVQTLSITVAR